MKKRKIAVLLALTLTAASVIGGCNKEEETEKPTETQMQTETPAATEAPTEQGKEFARDCMLNVLAVLEKETGDLNKVKNAVKVLVFVAGTEDFYEQPVVANGGTGLLTELFGDKAGAPARSAIGVYSLPGNIPVEIEAQFEI